MKSPLRMTRWLTAPLLFIAGMAVAAPPAMPDSWRTRLAQILPLMGHRNWIMIVDSAYPLQTSPGIETIETHAGQIEVTRAVLAALDGSIHVRPIVYLDAELPLLSEREAPGVTAYRTSLEPLLRGRPRQSLPHEQILAKVDEVGRMYHIVILKTTMAVPYTSVFLQLDCKYWTSEDEARFRKALAARATK